MQKSDLEIQREELRHQRFAAQRQTVLATFNFHEYQLNRISRNIIELSDAGYSSILDQNTRFNDRDGYARLILNNEELQTKITEQSESGETDLGLSIANYISIFRNLSEEMTSVDESGSLRQALLTDNPFSDLYYILLEIHPSQNDMT